MKILIAVSRSRKVGLEFSHEAVKTTLLNALLAEKAFQESRVVILEDTAELQCASPNCVQL